MAVSKSSATSPRFSSLRSSSREVALCAAMLTLLSAIAIYVVQRNGWALFYGDATAHINIARRLLDGRNPGYEQIGTVWLPLPHLAMAPLVQVDAWWRNGLAGALPGGIAWVIAGIFLFCVLRRLTGLSGAIAGSCVFALNPNLLYLQSAPMTEPYYLAGAIGMLLFSLRAADRRSNGDAALAGLCGIAAALTRYEGWFLLPFVAAYLLLSGGRRVAFVFCCVAALGPLYWLGHNRFLYSDPLEFYRGLGSAKDIQKGLPYPGAHDWWMALKQFWMATRMVNGWPLMLIAGLGLIPLLSARTYWPIFYLLLAPLYYVVNLHGGDSPLYVPQLEPFGHYNTRYALAALPLFALGTAGLASRFPRLKLVLPAVALGWFAWGPVLVFNEAVANSESRRIWTREVSELLREEYRPGTGIWMPFGDLTATLQEAGIPLRESIHQGDGMEYERNVQRPDLFLDAAWVVNLRGDAVSKAMAKTRGYVRVKLISLKYSPVIEVWRRSSQ